MLYIHGGGFVLGSPKSHRTLTQRFSTLTGAAVLAVDYRLMPEHSRMAGIEDCRNAYCWMLENGPQGPESPRAVFVAGDSAGGNLVLSLIAWVRDQSLRQPDAAVALSPLTDSTLGSPSLKANVRTDAMLGPLLGPLTRVPRSVLLWASWIQNRINPRNPVISPVFGDLSGLPPVLIHAGETEMLIDDCRRYVNRARAAGSPVTLQTWRHVVHVWHIFNPELTEARDALEHIGRFLRASLPASETGFSRGGQPVESDVRKASARPSRSRPHANKRFLFGKGLTFAPSHHIITGCAENFKAKFSSHREVVGSGCRRKGAAKGSLKTNSR
jgi:acetyl esterase/lipase